MGNRRVPRQQGWPFAGRIGPHRRRGGLRGPAVRPLIRGDNRRQIPRNRASIEVDRRREQPVRAQEPQGQDEKLLPQERYRMQFQSSVQFNRPPSRLSVLDLSFANERHGRQLPGGADSWTPLTNGPGVPTPSVACRFPEPAVAELEQLTL